MENQLFDLSGKVAVVTGGAGVLGSAMVKSLIDAGVKVGILGRTASKVEAKAAELGENALALTADVLDRSALEAARAKILEHWGKIDILVNCAGGNMPGATITPEQTFFDLSLDDLDKVTNLNFKGTVVPTLVFSEPMAAAKKGCIVNISSMAADRAITRVMGYSSAKASVDNFTKWLAVEMAHKHGEGIRVNAMAPGFFIADQNRRLLTNEDGSYTERGNTIIANTPMRRFGEPEELCSTLQWLCSDASGFVTGIVVPIDGGFSAFSGV